MNKTNAITQTILKPFLNSLYMTVTQNNPSTNEIYNGICPLTSNVLYTQMRIMVHNDLKRNNK